MDTEFTRELLQELGAPFPEDELEFLPRAQSGGKALGLAFIDARAVMRRLDAVVGPAGWSFDFDLLDNAGRMVKGRLTVLGVTKCDAGEAAQEDEVLKSAVSDSLKRCAVHFGIGRYLYYLPRVWAPYDAQKRRFIETPKLDRAAVSHALEICGVLSRPQSSAPAPRQPEARPAPQAQRAPESRGDRQAATQAVAGAEQHRSFTEPSLPQNPAPAAQEDLQLAAAGGKCPSCHAPAGKPHTRSCTLGTSAQAQGA